MTEIQIAILLIFITSAIALYALIESRKNYFMLFIFTPVILVTSVFSGSILYSLQGTPIPGIPEFEVEVLWVEMSKPDIYFMARNLETGGEPKYYTIPYTEKNKNEMNAIQEALANQQKAEGKFILLNGGSSQSESENYDFSLPDLPPEEIKPNQNTNISEWNGF
jgi:hypothetical protein